MSKQSEPQSLATLLASQKALLAQYLNHLSPNDLDSSTQLPSNPPNPLNVLRDSAKLLKAHTTKLSLLLINKPFTVSAITKVLRDISGTCLPAMMSAVDICRPDIWGAFLKQHVMASVRAVIREMIVCYDEATNVANQELEALAGSAQATEKVHQAQGRNSLVSTGLVWDACDVLINLDSIGIAGLAVRRAGEWRDTIKDATEELKEWEEGDEEEDDDDDTDSMDDMFSAANALPRNRPDLKERLATANDKLKKICMLYAAISKRRLKTFTPAIASIQKNIHTFDTLLTALKDLPDSVDDLASAFYDLNTDHVDRALQTCVDLATGAAQTVELSWTGEQDEFTTWVKKWSNLME
ncbi:hypothetical protein AAFC00_005966 [Neodothiora populina]|uniref:Cyclin-D1-binding protein 1-like N-terminal domain-containing protein n=1 Tax=Neodothiora populina TaxID=2781224 RepID=A0ABR3P6I3_9PEZI